MLPMIHVVIAGTNGHWLSAMLCNLRTASRKAPADSFDERFSATVNPAELLDIARSDGALQAVLIDGDTPGVAALISRLQGLRREIDIFVATNDPVGLPGATCMARGDAPDGEELCTIRNAILNRAATPFADTLREYVDSAPDAWHTPGHSGGDSLRESLWAGDYYTDMGAHAFRADLSVSVEGLDSLLQPRTIIQQAQNLAARAFGAERTFFVTNGTSTANKVIMQYLLGGGGTVILDQACHKSVHHAVILFGLRPVYLQPALRGDYGLYGPVPRRRITAAIDAHPEASLLVLTSCTYDGFRYDLAPVIEYAHSRGIRVLVDEAWYAHGCCHPELRPTALECGADYVTQSTHKMLSAFSQASMIHVADPQFEESRFREHLNMHTSTSPQYAMIASLDVARRQMSMEGFSIIDRCLAHAAYLREQVAATGVFRVLALEDMLPAELAGDGVRLDPTKLTLDIGCFGLEAARLQLLLFRDYGIQVEKITPKTLTLLATAGITGVKVERLLAALRQIAATWGESGGTDAEVPVPALPPISEIVTLPRTAFFGTATLISLEDGEGGPNRRLVGRVSADSVVPYPPGIPVLVPGQRVTADILAFVYDLLCGERHSEVHGICSEDGRYYLRVADGA